MRSSAPSGSAAQKARIISSSPRLPAPRPLQICTARVLTLDLGSAAQMAGEEELDELEAESQRGAHAPPHQARVGGRRHAEVEQHGRVSTLAKGGLGAHPGGSRSSLERAAPTGGQV